MQAKELSSRVAANEFLPAESFLSAEVILRSYFRGITRLRGGNKLKLFSHERCCLWPYVVLLAQLTD